MTKDDDILEQLDVIQVHDLPSDIPDTLTIASQTQYDYEKKKMEIERLKAELENLKGAYILSTWFAICIFLLVLISLIMVFGIVIWQGDIAPAMRLSDNSIITILSTTTVNIIGLLYLVIKYVFHHRLKI